MEVEVIIVMDITMMVMGIFLAGAMIMGAMCINLVSVDLQVAGQRTLLVEDTLAVEGMRALGEAEGDETYM
jgi:hypothetical protein